MAVARSAEYTNKGGEIESHGPVDKQLFDLGLMAQYIDRIKTRRSVEEISDVAYSILAASCEDVTEGSVTGLPPGQMARVSGV
jgi:hypothetical protein